MAIEKRYNEGSERPNESIVRPSVIADKKDLKKPKVEEKIPFQFDSSRISDIKYLEDIFSAEYDQFKSLAFLRENLKVLLAQGYPQTPTLNEYLFWTTLSRRMQIIYQKNHQYQMTHMNDNSNLVGAENIAFLKAMQDIADRIITLQKSLDASFQLNKSVRDVVDLHKETCEKAERYLRGHFGEYVKINSTSGKITDITDKAYWCFVQDIIVKDTGPEKVDYVWSEELKYLVDLKLIPLYFMAFVLRTSVEGIFYTAKIRNDKLEEVNKEEAEKKLKELMLDWERIRHEKDMELIGK